MKYNIGDKVKIISRERLSRFPMDSDGDYDTGKLYFIKYMFCFCGKIAIITDNSGNYKIDLDGGAFNWTDEMFEDSVEHHLHVKKLPYVVPLTGKMIRRSSILANLEID